MCWLLGIPGEFVVDSERVEVDGNSVERVVVVGHQHDAYEIECIEHIGIGDKEKVSLQFT